MEEGKTLNLKKIWESLFRFCFCRVKKVYKFYKIGKVQLFRRPVEKTVFTVTKIKTANKKNNKTRKGDLIELFCATRV